MATAGGELLARASGDLGGVETDMSGWPEVVAEHRALATLLERMREAAFGYTLSPGLEEDADDVARWKDLYDWLRDLEIDVRRHIYIEEELLMPLMESRTT
jgi:iron-sulfur cluster repair protein YtfE (RIC family)